MKVQIEKVSHDIMEAGKIYKLAGHKSGPKDSGLWKLVRVRPIDEGDTCVTMSWFKCPGPLKNRFECCAVINMHDGLSFMALKKRSVHNDDSHNQNKDKS